jgi:nucleotide-binding universal stress UspA family protein
MKPDIKNILYATDLSPNAKHAFSYAADLAVKYQAQITILYVMENMNHLVESQVKEMLGTEQWEKIKAEKTGYLINTIRSRIDEFCTGMNAQFDACHLLVSDILIKKGNPTEQILAVAENLSADMIVMGSHGHNVLQNALIGGTARKVVQSSRLPVLVIRLPES